MDMLEKASRWLQAECFKGDFDDESWIYRARSRADVSILFNGVGPNDFTLVWDGMTVASGLQIGALMRSLKGLGWAHPFFICLVCLGLGLVHLHDDFHVFRVYVERGAWC